MVIFAAVGGKMSLLGAVYGTLAVNTGKSLFSENFPQLWLFLMGGLFIAVVMFFPNGLAGLWESARARLSRLSPRSGAAKKIIPMPAMPQASNLVETEPKLP
jgi:urea transport system permease protein